MSGTTAATLAFAYSHDGSLDASNGVIPDYANGGPLGGGGSFYFTSNATTGDIDSAGQFAQDIDVTGHDGASFELGASFSSYSSDGDFGTLAVEFFDAAGAPLGTTEVSDSDPSTWTAESTNGVIPVGSTVARVSVYGTPLRGGPDGYVDNVGFTIVPEPGSVALGAAAMGGVFALRRRRRE